MGLLLVSPQAVYVVRERWARFKLLLEYADEELRRTDPDLCVARVMMAWQLPGSNSSSALTLSPRLAPQAALVEGVAH